MGITLTTYPKRKGHTMPTDQTAPTGIFDTVWPQIFNMLKDPLGGVLDPLTAGIEAP